MSWVSLKLLAITLALSVPLAAFAQAGRISGVVVSVEGEQGPRTNVPVFLAVNGGKSRTAVTGTDGTAQVELPVIDGGGSHVQVVVQKCDGEEQIVVVLDDTSDPDCERLTAFRVTRNGTTHLKVRITSDGARIARARGPSAVSGGSWLSRSSPFVQLALGMASVSADKACAGLDGAIESGWLGGCDADKTNINFGVYTGLTLFHTQLGARPVQIGAGLGYHRIGRVTQNVNLRSPTDDIFRSDGFFTANSVTPFVWTGFYVGVAVVEPMIGVNFWNATSGADTYQDFGGVEQSDTHRQKDSGTSLRYGLSIRTQVPALYNSTIGLTVERTRLKSGEHYGAGVNETVTGIGAVFRVPLPI